MAEALAAGEQVVVQKFGAFKVMPRAARKGRDFKGNTLDIPAGKKVVFRPFSDLRKSVIR